MSANKNIDEDNQDGLGDDPLNHNDNKKNPIDDNNEILFDDNDDLFEDNQKSLNDKNNNVDHLKSHNNKDKPLNHNDNDDNLKSKNNNGAIGDDNDDSLNDNNNINLFNDFNIPLLNDNHNNEELKDPIEHNSSDNDDDEDNYHFDTNDDPLNDIKDDDDIIKEISYHPNAHSTHRQFNDQLNKYANISNKKPDDADHDPNVKDIHTLTESSTPNIQQENENNKKDKSRVHEELVCSTNSANDKKITENINQNNDDNGSKPEINDHQSTQNQNMQTHLSIQETSYLDQLENKEKLNSNNVDYVDFTIEDNINHIAQAISNDSNPSNMRLGSTSIEKRKKLLQLQKEHLMSEQINRFSYSGLNKESQKSSNEINYKKTEENNVCEVPNLQEEFAFYDPTMHSNKKPSNLPKLSKMDYKISFQKQNEHQTRRLDDIVDNGGTDSVFGNKQDEPEKPPQKSLSLTQLKIMKVDEFDGIDIKDFLTNPCPTGKLIQCTIKVDNSGLKKLCPKFYCYLSNSSKFLMVGKKRGDYLISYDKNFVNKYEPSYIGKLKSNFWGTKYNLFDHPKNLQKNKQSSKQSKNLLSVILYDLGLFNNDGPRKMKVLIPQVETTEKLYEFKSTDPKKELLSNDKARKTNHLKELINKPPKWNESMMKLHLCQ